VTEPHALLTQEYDLRYRPLVGDRSYYSLDIVYRTLGPNGTSDARENYRGFFSRDVESVDPSGKVGEKITWRHVAKRSAVGTGDYGAWEKLDYAENFTYNFSAEDSYEDFHWDYGKFPNDLFGWFAVLLTVDAHFEFDFLRSSHHGAIEKLRRVGDSVLAPDSGEPFRLHHGDVVECPDFNKQNLRTSFAGLTQVNGHPCALLRFMMDASPFTMSMMGAHIKASSTFEGTISVRLADGSVEHGEFEEFVFQETGPISPIYELVRLDQNQFEAGY
jgi:hypothetical protein